jgi:hypothetical protein
MIRLAPRIQCKGFAKAVNQIRGLKRRRLVQAGDHGDNAGETFRLAEAASPGCTAFSADSASFLKAGLDSAI